MQIFPHIKATPVKNRNCILEQRVLITEYGEFSATFPELVFQ